MKDHKNFVIWIRSWLRHRGWDVEGVRYVFGCDLVARKFVGGPRGAIMREVWIKAITNESFLENHLKNIAVHPIPRQPMIRDTLEVETQVWIRGPEWKRGGQIEVKRVLKDFTKTGAPKHGLGGRGLPEPAVKLDDLYSAFLIELGKILRGTFYRAEGINYEFGKTTMPFKEI